MSYHWHNLMGFSPGCGGVQRHASAEPLHRSAQSNISRNERGSFNAVVTKTCIFLPATSIKHIFGWFFGQMFGSKSLNQNLAHQKSSQNITKWSIFCWAPTFFLGCQAIYRSGLEKALLSGSSGLTMRSAARFKFNRWFSVELKGIEKMVERDAKSWLGLKR